MIPIARITQFKEVRHIPDLIYPGDPPMEDGVFYVVDNSPYVQYKCPCGCGNEIMLPTSKHQDGYHGWGFIEDNGKVTLSPSVYSTGLHCRSHYFIRSNRIEWC